MKCPNCGIEFDDKTGRRPKRFCTEPCKVKFWNAQKKAASKKKEPPVPKTTWTTPAGLEELAKKAFHEKPIIIGNTVEVSQNRIFTTPDEIQKQIDKLTAEMNTFGNGQLGERMKNATRKKIENLKKLLK